MKKKVLVVFTGAIDLGGIERSLLGLLDSFDYDKYDVDLFLYGHHGVLFPLINKNVNILPEVKELAYLRESFKEKLKHGCYYSALTRIVDSIKSVFHPVNHDKTWAKIMRKKAPKLKKHYDLAISFFRPFDYIIEKVDANIKMGWIHTDYTKANEDLNALFKDYVRMDYIAGVSEQCVSSFIGLFPQLSNKLITIENILPKGIIDSDFSYEDTSSTMPNDGSIKLLSIGRFCEAKNFDNVPDICKKLVNKGLNVKWYLIGYGTDEQLIKERIVESEMQDRVIILGKITNPYPYIKTCDIYVQPSRYEGKCVSVIEAQFLHKPVVITNYPTSSSQLKDGFDGIIVPMDNEGCAEGITRLINNQSLQDFLIENTKSQDYTNSQEIEKIYRLMSDNG